MHILKIIHGYPPHYNAGSEVYSQSICNQLSKNNKVSVFTREENLYLPDFSLRHEAAKPNLDIYFVNNAKGKDGYRHEQLDTAFAQLIAKVRPDVAHIGHLNHLSTGLVHKLKNQSIPIVFTLHDFWLMCPRGQFLTRGTAKDSERKVCNGQDNQKCANQCYSQYYSGLDERYDADEEYWSAWVAARMEEAKRLSTIIDLFIAPSNFIRNKFITEYNIPRNKIVYLDYGIDSHHITQFIPRQRQDKFTIGYIGTLIEAKGVNLLINAVKKLEIDCRLLIFGDANNQSGSALQKLAEKSGKDIELAGKYINQDLADKVFSQVDCIVVPSIWEENSPLVIHEAQACQIPVITADVGGMAEYVQHLENGLLFRHRNEDSLREQLQFAILNPEKMIALGKRGYLNSPNGDVPSIEDHCKVLESMYKSLAEKPKLWRITIDTNPEDCNLKCIMCEEHSPYSSFIPKLYKETGIKRRRMPFSTVQSIIEQAAALGITEIVPSTMGEPLLYKEFDRFYALAAKSGLKVNLTTNGTFPKKTVLEWAKIIVPNTSDIKISWNGATKKTSELIMLGIDFDKTIENVKSFIKYRNQFYNKTGYYCRVTFQLTFMDNNMHELADIVKLAAHLGVDRVKGHQLWAHFPEIQTLSMAKTRESRERWNAYVLEAKKIQRKYLLPNGKEVFLENFTALNYSSNLELQQDYECPFLNKELWISATGKISPCCAPDHLRSSLGDFGNIMDRSISEAINSDEYIQLVQTYKLKNVCKTCIMRKPI